MNAAHKYINQLVQERRNSSALAMELRLSCTKALRTVQWAFSNKEWMVITPELSWFSFSHLFFLFCYLPKDIEHALHTLSQWTWSHVLGTHNESLFLLPWSMLRCQCTLPPLLIHVTSHVFDVYIIFSRHLAYIHHCSMSTHSNLNKQCFPRFSWSKLWHSLSCFSHIDWSDINNLTLLSIKVTWQGTCESVYNKST